MRYLYLLFIIMFAMSLPIYGYAGTAVLNKQVCPMEQSDKTINKMDCCHGMTKMTQMCSSGGGCTTMTMSFLPTKITAAAIVVSTASVFHFDTTFIKSPPASIWRPPA